MQVKPYQLFQTTIVNYLCQNCNKALNFMKIILFLLILLPQAIVSQSEGELFFSYDKPLGNIAVTTAKDLPVKYYFTLHPEGKPKGAKVFEIVDGTAKPFPNSAFQENFISPFGIYLDQQNRLWILDHANYALKKPKLFCFNAGNGDLIFEYTFPKEIVRKWVMLNDLTVTPNGKYVFISAPGMFKKRSSIIIYNTEDRTSRKILTDHPSVMRKKVVIEVDDKKMRFLLGLFKVRPGVDGIDMDRRGKYLYYTALSDSSVYRVPIVACIDPMVTDEKLGEISQWIGNRPYYDGIRMDQKENIYITDFTNHRILSMDPAGELKVVLENKNIRWADGLSIGADGYLYITDSALQHVILKSKKKIRKHQPFEIWRIKLNP